MPPLVDLVPLPIDRIAGRPDNFAVTPGAADLDHGSDAPTPWIMPEGRTDVMGAAIRQGNVIGSAISRQDRGITYDREPGFNPWDAIKGTPYEPHWQSFVDIRNTAAADARKRQIDMEEEDKRTIDGAPWYMRLPAQLLAGAADPTMVAPGAAFSRTTDGAISILRTAAANGIAAGAGAAVQEAGLHATQETRTGAESAENIGASVFLGGLIGAAGAKLLSRAEWNSGVAAINRDLARLEVPRETLAPETVTAPASAGAAAREAPTLAENTIAGRAARTSAAATRALNPFMRVMQNPSTAARDTIQRLAEFTGYTEGNFSQTASPIAAETKLKRWQGGVTVATQEGQKIFEDYVKAGGTLREGEFRRAVGMAMRRDDEADEPAIAAAAKVWRDKVVDPLKDAAVEVGLLPADVAPKFAPSYFSRMWNKNRIIGEEGRFKNIVQEFAEAHIGQEWETATKGFNARKAALDQELSDINLAPEARAAKLEEIEGAIRTHEEGGEAYLGLSGKADELNDLRAKARDIAQDKTMVPRDREAALADLKTRREALTAAGGEDLKKFVSERANLRARRRNIDLGAAGLAERSTRILESLADLEETTQRTLGRLVDKGRKLERDLDKLDPDMLAERISGIKDQFAGLAQRSDAAADRAAKALETIRAKAEKTAAKEGEAAQVAGANAIHGNPEEKAANVTAAREARQRATAAREKADAAAASRLEKEETAQRARSARMSEVAQRLAVAENFDRAGAVAELRAATAKAVAETADTALARGERAQRLKERLEALDPQRVKDRADTIGRMKAEMERAYYDRWETKALGEGVDPASGVRPNFTEHARAIADHIFNTFTGRTEAGLRPEFAKITTRGPMKDRTFHIPDLYVSPAHGAIEDFLEHDVKDVMTRYSRVMGADVEVQRQFGSLDLADEMGKITESYDKLRTEVTDPKALLKLADREKSDKNDIRGVLDAIRGTRAVGQLERDYGHIVRSANHVQYLLKMGEVVLSSLQDALRPAMVHGLMPYMRTIGQLATNLQAVKLSARDAQLMGNIAERVTPARLATIAELGDPMARRGPVEAMLANLTDIASKWNGIRLWTDGWKAIASTMTQNRILENAGNWEGLSKRERAYMQFLGLDQGMAERIAAQFETHGDTLGGVRWANVAAWGEKDPVARDAFAAAMNKDVDSIIVIPSKADVPLLAHTPIGKTLLQFKSFTLASHQRVMLRGLQESPARFISGAIGMTALGMLQTYLKAVSGNHLDQLKSITEDPGWWVGEAIDRASFMPVFMELSNDFEKFTHVNPIKSPLKLGDKGSTESQKVMGDQPYSLLGPNVSTVLGDVPKVLGTLGTLKEGKDVTKGEKSAMTRLMPFNSYLGMKQFLNYVVNPPQH